MTVVPGHGPVGRPAARPSAPWICWRRGTDAGPSGAGRCHVDGSGDELLGRRLAGLRGEADGQGHVQGVGPALPDRRERARGTARRPTESRSPQYPMPVGKVRKDHGGCPGAFSTRTEAAVPRAVSLGDDVAINPADEPAPTYVVPVVPAAAPPHRGRRLRHPLQQRPPRCPTRRRRRRRRRFHPPPRRLRPRAPTRRPPPGRPSRRPGSCRRAARCGARRATRPDPVLLEPQPAPGPPMRRRPPRRRPSTAMVGA